MAEISIKVFLRCQDEEEEVRRFSLERSAGSCVSYKQLVARLEAMFPQLEAAVYRVSWTDEEGDAVTISTDEELGIALAEMSTHSGSLLLARRDRETMRSWNKRMNWRGLLLSEKDLVREERAGFDME